MEFSGEFSKRFVLEAELVKRPSATVYRAKDKELGRDVALKIFVDRPGENQQWRERFEAEMSLLRTATHPVLVPIVATGLEEGVFYIAMELLGTRNLRDLIKDNEEGIEIDKAITYVSQLGEGLGEIHELGTLHGHLDSRGVLFKGEEVRLAGYYPRVIDEIHRSVSSEGRLIIDSHYIAPEQITSSEKADHRADIYALSIVLFELVTGKRPFSSSNPLQTAMKRLTEQPPSPASLRKDISPLLDGAIMKGLSRNPDERFKTVDDLLDAITGGKKTQKNPFVGMDSERLGTDTIAVSMSADVLKQMLGGHQKETKQEEPTKPEKQEAPTMDVESTVIGMQISGVLKASIVVLDGKEQGKRFALDQPQMMIGSDIHCQISLSEKDSPKRYAIISQRGENYFIEPLSPKGLTINGESIKEETEVFLKRGDVINIGNNLRLRFVAPGEVFTLRENIADRSIDRPKSKIPRVAMVATAAALCLLLVFAYLSRDKLATKRVTKASKEAQIAKEREAVVAKLMREGDEYYNQGALYEPLGANAREKYEKILELDSENIYAKKRLTDIESRSKVLAEEKNRREQRGQRLATLQDEAIKYFNRGDYVFPPGKNARETYQEILNLDPTHEIAKKKIAEIDLLVSDLLGQVVTRLARAQVYKELGQYVEPEGENAFSEVQSVLKIDSKNEQAKTMLLEMAAESIYEGDSMKLRAKGAEMRRAYLTAQAMGVDPSYIENRLRGSDILQKSKAGIIIVNRKDDEKEKNSEKNGGSFLDTTEIERRVSAISLREQESESGDQKILIDLGKQKGNS